MSVASRQLIKGFNLTGVSAPDFFRSADDIEKYAGRHPYSHFMRRAWQQLHLNGILCIEGRPTVYFKGKLKGSGKIKGVRHLFSIREN